MGLSLGFLCLNCRLINRSSSSVFQPVVTVPGKPLPAAASCAVKVRFCSMPPSRPTRQSGKRSSHLLRKGRRFPHLPQGQSAQIGRRRRGDSRSRPLFDLTTETRHGTLIFRSIATLDLLKLDPLGPAAPGSRSAPQLPNLAFLALPHARQVACLVRNVRDKKGRRPDIPGCRLFIGSREADEASRHPMARLIRKHWSVENKVHWPRDAVLAEDRARCRLPAIACALALLRTSLLALVHASGFSSVTLATEHFAHNSNAAFNKIRHQQLTSLR